MTLSTPTLPRVIPADWPRGWRAAAGLTCVAAGAAIVAGALLPWVEAFAGLVQVPGVRGLNGRILAAAGAFIAVAGLYQLVRGGSAARWVAGLAGFAAAGFSGYLLIQLTRTMRALGGDSMVFARGGPGLWVAAAGSTAALATLLFPPAPTQTPRRDTLFPPAASQTPHRDTLVPPAAAPPPRRDTRRRVLAWAADRESAGPRRALQIALGTVWLFDTALQFQPYMFSKMFPAMMLAPSGMGGEPAFVSGPVLGAARLFSSAPAAWNALFATIQLALAIGLQCRPTVRAALAGTVAWALTVWWVGEGLGGLFTRAADPLTGAPGAALLYAFLAVLLWPTRAAVVGPSLSGGTASGGTASGIGRAGTSVADGSPLARHARLAWLVLWGALAVLILRAPASAAPLTAVGGTRAALVIVGLAVAFGLAAAGILVPATARAAVLIAAISAAFVWAAGEHFGSLFSGSATDLNSGPLLLLIAAAFWPRRQR
jgi:hypothetical protein